MALHRPSKRWVAWMSASCSTVSASRRAAAAATIGSVLAGVAFNVGAAVITGALTRPKSVTPSVAEREEAARTGVTGELKAGANVPVWAHFGPVRDAG